MLQSGAWHRAFQLSSSNRSRDSSSRHRRRINVDKYCRTRIDSQTSAATSIHSVMGLSTTCIYTQPRVYLMSPAAVVAPTSDNRTIIIKSSVYLAINVIIIIDYKYVQVVITYVRIPKLLLQVCKRNTYYTRKFR